MKWPQMSLDATKWHVKFQIFFWGDTPPNPPTRGGTPLSRTLPPGAPTARKLAKGQLGKCFIFNLGKTLKLGTHQQSSLVNFFPNLLFPGMSGTPTLVQHGQHVWERKVTASWLVDHNMAKYRVQSGARQVRGSEKPLGPSLKCGGQISDRKHYSTKLTSERKGTLTTVLLAVSHVFSTALRVTVPAVTRRGKTAP